jgi:WXG100 family type VII secretion target
MSTYAVSSTAMQATSEDIATISGNIQSLLDSLESDVEKLLVYWTGGARDQYFEAKTRWDAAARDMPVAISAAQQTLNSILQQYMAGESVAGSVFGG